MREICVWSLGWEDALEKGKATPFQHSGQENSIGCIIHGVAKSGTQLSDDTFHNVKLKSNNMEIWHIFSDHDLLICKSIPSVSSVLSLSHVRFFVTSWTAASQAYLSITNSQTLLKLMCIELVMPSNHLILCCPLLLPPSIFPSIGVFSNESVLRFRWPKYWSFSFLASAFPRNSQDWFPLG